MSILRLSIDWKRYPVLLALNFGPILRVPLLHLRASATLISSVPPCVLAVLISPRLAAVMSVVRGEPTAWDTSEAVPYFVGSIKRPPGLSRSRHAAQ